MQPVLPWSTVPLFSIWDAGSLNLVERRFDVKGLVEWFWQYVPIIWLAFHYNNG